MTNITPSVLCSMYASFIQLRQSPNLISARNIAALLPPPQSTRESSQLFIIPSPRTLGILLIQGTDNFKSRDPGTPISVQPSRWSSLKLATFPASAPSACCGILLSPFPSPRAEIEAPDKKRSEIGEELLSGNYLQANLSTDACCP